MGGCAAGWRQSGGWLASVDGRWPTVPLIVLFTLLLSCFYEFPLLSRVVLSSCWVLLSSLSSAWTRLVEGGLLAVVSIRASFCQEEIVRENEAGKSRGPPMRGCSSNWACCGKA